LNVARILVVEDERQLAELIAENLRSAGHTVALAADGRVALTMLEGQPADLVILDWMLPGLDGLEVCRRIRAVSITPILMLTARAAEIDRVLGLEVGADDYLTKPFSMPELLARARALLRRVELMRGESATEGDARHTLTVGDLTIDLDGRVARIGDRDLGLTPKELDLLAMLVRQPGRAYSREYLLEQIWGVEYIGFDRTVDSHVVRLRKKLGPHGDRVATVWGIGYKWTVE
jgi:DNA-binding response OmpR family regulator